MFVTRHCFRDGSDFKGCKYDNFQLLFFIIFVLFLLKTLIVDKQGGVFNENLQSLLKKKKKKKKMDTPVNPSFII